MQLLQSLVLAIMSKVGNLHHSIMSEVSVISNTNQDLGM